MNIKKWIIISCVVMTFGVKAMCLTNSMDLAFIMLYGVIPAYSVLIGIVSGTDIRKKWFLPVLSAAFYALGVVLFFATDDMAFWSLGGLYLAIGLISMFLSVVVSNAIKEKKHKS